ncbi:MAG: ribonuclease III domain-containing protein [Clostridia bacterium]
MNLNEKLSAHSAIESSLGIKPINPNTLSPLTLAYIGDSVYDMFVRTYLIHISSCTVHGLHCQATKLVCAAAQSDAFHKIEGMLLENELAVYKRGRNAHSGTTPKNASLGNYRVATGFEALIGYLYLSGSDARLIEIMKTAVFSSNDEGK